MSLLLIVNFFQSHVYQCSVITRTKVNKLPQRIRPVRKNYMQEYMIATLRSTV